MNDYIKLQKRNTLKIGIQDEDGNVKLDENGKEVFIEFDMEDINLLDNYDKCVYLVEKAGTTLKMKIKAIKNKQDGEGKYFLTKNQKAQSEAIKEYYKSMEEAMDLFLGEGGTNKIFGNKRYMTMFDDLSENLKPIMPKLKMNVESITNQIKTKYSATEDNVLKDE